MSFILIADAAAAFSSCLHKRLRLIQPSLKRPKRLYTLNQAFQTKHTYNLLGKDDEVNIETVSHLPEEMYQLQQLGFHNLASHFPFELDDWQLHAGGCIYQGYNVIVCAPTGAGKTVVGEMALVVADTKYQQKGMYTTPLKALSNQKYSELIPRFGRNRVGLSTGDISINKGADMTVMTTEVYRNIAWRADSAVADETLQQTAVVVLDEFHYMGLPGRGGVWEESVITSPPHIQIVALSATLSNAEQLASWMETVTQRKTVLVQVPAFKRPVPLRYLYCTKEGLYPLFRDPDAGPGAPKGLLGLRGDGLQVGQNRKQSQENKMGFSSSNKDIVKPNKLPKGLQVNPALKAAAEKRMQRVARALERAKIEATSMPRTHRMFDLDHDYSSAPPRRMSPRDERKERDRLLKKEMRRAVPSLQGIVNRLQQRDLLPAIFFLFSRAGCDNAARTLYHCMKGPRDPNGLQVDERDQFENFDETRPASKAKFKTRQRSKRRDARILEDSNGRLFRTSSNYIREDLLAMLFEAPSDSSEEEESSEESTLLSSENWDFCARAGLLTYKEVKDVANRISKFNEDNPEIAFDDEIIEQYYFGIGSHHAGMLPAHKSFVEVLYRNQLMKVVFATETLAAGINMPARTTVICALAKNDGGSSMSLLETSNLLQMAGRAGRRGMDTDGTCVIVATPFEDHDDAARILTDPIKPITSQFRPSYALAINLILRGEGKLDVARQLVSKSFAMWEKSQVDGNPMSNVVNEDSSLHTEAQAHFMVSLVKVMQLQIDRRRAKFDIARIYVLVEILNNRGNLKKISKSYLGYAQMLELEKSTLGYLERELVDTQLIRAKDSEDLTDNFEEEEQNILDQIDLQRNSVIKLEKDVSKHPFVSIAQIANEIMNENSTEAKDLLHALRMARQGQRESDIKSNNLTTSELLSYSKAFVTRRKSGKMLTDDASLEKKASEDIRAYAWNDMLSIIKTLIAYGCITLPGPNSIFDDIAIEEQTLSISLAGINVGMLGFENSLWALVALGGAWNIAEDPSKFENLPEALDSFDSEPYDWNENEEGIYVEDRVPKSQQEAQKLVAQLQALSISELAGYVSSIITENSRGLGLPVVELFERLTVSQQKAIQTALACMEHLTVVQKSFSVDEVTRNCILDISNCEVVTAWASGCSWGEALEISKLPPGDLARTLSRALDALRQFGNLPYVPLRKSDFDGSHLLFSRGIHPDIKSRCRDAARAINRYPVKDPLAFDTSEDAEEMELQDDVGEESDNEVIT